MNDAVATTRNVADAEILHRRVPPIWVKDNGRPCSAAFDHLDMSVDRAAITSPEETLRNHENFGIVSLVTKQMRDLDLPVVPDPILLNPGHALVKGKKTGSIKKQIVRLARWVITPSERNGRATPQKGVESASAVAMKAHGNPGDDNVGG